MARHYSRTEFHALVWSKPMTHLAKEFGLSDVALHKICRKHDIPTPPLGWWAKKAAGKPVKQTPLPGGANPERREVAITAGYLGKQGDVMRDARERARVVAATTDTQVSVGTRGVIERTMQALRDAKPSDGMVSVSGSDLIESVAAVASLDRLATILWSIAPAAAAQGFQLASGGHSACFRSDTETVSWSIKETVARARHALTEAEKAEEKTWEAKRDRASRRNPWDALLFDRPRFPDWDYHPTGEFSLEFETVYVVGAASPRRTFRDTKTQRLDVLGPDIAVALAVLAAVKAEERIRREARAREQELERQCREAIARADFIQQRRAKGLASILNELAELDRLRTLIALLGDPTGDDGGPRVAGLLAFATEELSAREAALGSRGLEERLGSDRLFGPDDDRDYGASRRY